MSATGRAAVINRLRRLQARDTQQPSSPGPERCDFCGTELPGDHRHVLDTKNRRILCACGVCFIQGSQDPRYSPTGTRVLWLESFALADELWGRFSIPVGLAFFFRSSVADAVVALYPSPLGATESELDMSAWEDLVAANPALERLEPDAEALLVNRTLDPPAHAIVPIDRCYELVGLVKSKWEGISGGREADEAVASFFQRLKRDAPVQPP